MGERVPGHRRNCGDSTAVWRVWRATGERADWQRVGACACVARAGGGAAGYPSCVLPEPDVDKWRLSLCHCSEDSTGIEVKATS